MIIIFINAWLSLLGPYLIGHTIDTYIQSKQYHGVIIFSAILMGIYITAFVTNYLQIKIMGGVGQRMLYSLRTPYLPNFRNCRSISLIKTRLVTLFPASITIPTS